MAQSRYLSLAPELRNAISDLVLYNQDPVVIVFRLTARRLLPGQYRLRPRFRDHGLLTMMQLNRQLRSEAGLSFWRLNTFRLPIVLPTAPGPEISPEPEALPNPFKTKILRNCITSLLSEGNERIGGIELDIGTWIKRSFAGNATQDVEPKPELVAQALRRAKKEVLKYDANLRLTAFVRIRTVCYGYAAELELRISFVDGKSDRNGEWEKALKKLRERTDLTTEGRAGRYKALTKCQEMLESFEKASEKAFKDS